jgi:hypothetical protein
MRLPISPRHTRPAPTRPGNARYRFGQARRSRPRGEYRGGQSDLRDGARELNVLFRGGPLDGELTSVNFLDVVLERRARDGHVQRYVPSGETRELEGHRLAVFDWRGHMPGR